MAYHTLFILPYKRSSDLLIILPDGPGVQFYWSRSSRPKSAFAALAITASSSFPMSSYSPATSDPGIEPVLVSEPLVLRRIPFTLGRQYHPLSPRVGAVDTPPPRCFSADYTKLTKVRCHSTWLTSISAQYINNIYSARVPMHFLVTHGYETPAF